MSLPLVHVRSVTIDICAQAQKLNPPIRPASCFQQCEFTVKKLKVDLTQENVISVALWFHLGPGSGPPPVAMVKGYTPFPVKNSSKT